MAEWGRGWCEVAGFAGRGCSACRKQSMRVSFVVRSTAASRKSYCCYSTPTWVGAIDSERNLGAPGPAVGAGLVCGTVGELPARVRGVCVAAQLSCRWGGEWDLLSSSLGDSKMLHQAQSATKSNRAAGAAHCQHRGWTWSGGMRGWRRWRRLRDEAQWARAILL